MIGAVVIAHARGFPLMGGMAYGPAFFPVLIGAGFVICGLILSGQAALARGGVKVPPKHRDLGVLWRIAIIPAIILGYAVVTPVAGFLPTIALAALGTALFFGLRPLSALVLALVIAATLFVLFQWGLRVPLPAGPLERWLG
jgi:putative tricarboxylic transport membrane protein